MANQEHLELVKNRRWDWDKWRQEECFEIPDLSEANLSFANLADLDLSHTNLRGASLIRANLVGANLNGANLRFANLSEAHVGRTLFVNNDLSTTRGLESVTHQSPSTIGVDTVYKSDGKISEGFLRGVGAPEDFITFIPSLVGRAIEFYSCFISYGHQDEAFSQLLHSRMRSERLRVWYAPEDMKGGRKLHEEIFRAIQIHDKLLLVLSGDSMKSEWDADGGKDLAVEGREYYIPDFSNWKDHDSFESEFAKLLRDLKSESA